MGRSSFLRRMKNILSSHEEVNIFQNILRDVNGVHLKVKEESMKFATMSSEAQQRRLLVLFQKDLLAGVSGEIAEKKSMQGKLEDRKPVSKGAKLCGFVFILVLNLTLLLYIFMFAVKQDSSRQSAWVQSFLIWLALEIFLVSSLVMVMSEFVVPSLVFSEVKKIKTKMIKTVCDYQFKMLKGDTFRETNNVDEAAFNAAPYLFTSTRLATKFPRSLESKIIREFRTNLPKRSYQHHKNSANSSMNVYRRRLRLTAVMNSVNLVFLFIIGRLLSSSISSLERCFYDLFSWVVIGFFIFWQVFLFQDNAVLIVVIFSTMVIAVGLFLFFYYRSKFCRRTITRAGVISITAMFDKKKREMESRNQTSQPEEVGQVGTRNERITGKFYPRFVQAMVSMRDAPANNERQQRKRKRNTVVHLNTDGNVHTVCSVSKKHSKRAILPVTDNPNADIRGQVVTTTTINCPSSLSHPVDMEVAVPSSSSSPVEMSKYVKVLQEKTPLLVKKIRSYKPALRNILQRREAARRRKSKLKRALDLDVNLSDCSNDSDSDNFLHNYAQSSDNDDSLSSSSGSDQDEAASFYDGENTTSDDCFMGDEHTTLDSASQQEVESARRKYGYWMQDNTPRMARKIRAHKTSLRRILRRRQAAPGMKQRLKRDVALEVDLSDCSDDLYPDGMSQSSNDNDQMDEEGNDMFSLSSDDDGDDMITPENDTGIFSLSSDSDSDTDSVDQVNQVEKVNDKVDEEGNDMFSLSSDGDESSQVHNIFSLSSDIQDDIIYHLSSDSEDIDLVHIDDNSEGSGYRHSMGNISTASVLPSHDVAREYVDVTQVETPSIARKIRSHQRDLRVMLQQRTAARRMKRRLMEEGVEVSDDSDDDYGHERKGDSMFSLSSDSNDEQDVVDSNSNSDSDIAVPVITTSVSARPRTLKENMVSADSSIFAKPKRNNSLSQRIRRNRDGIQKAGLKKRVQSIEDSFVLNTEARRTSTLANRARAHTNLHKRIQQRNATAATMSPMKHDNCTIQPSPSIDYFKEKKAMMKNYTAYQSLREHSLETQRQEAKAALQLRRKGVKKNLPETAV